MKRRRVQDSRLSKLVILALISFSSSNLLNPTVQSVSQSVVYSFSMHKKRHTMTSVKAEQCETTVYAYFGWSEGAVLIKSTSPTLPLQTSILKRMVIRKAQAKQAKKKKTTRHRVINIVVNSCKKKKTPYTSSKKAMKTLLYAVSHNYVIVSLLIIQQ